MFHHHRRQGRKSREGTGTVSIDELSGYDNDVDTLNVVLDGQKVSLDTKYGRVKNRRMYQFF